MDKPYLLVTVSNFMENSIVLTRVKLVFLLFYYRSSSNTRGTDTANISEGAEDVKQTLLYIPSQDTIRENLAKLNPQFSKWVKLWSKGQFVSMVIPTECDNEILASETGTAFGAANKGKTYDVYR